MCYLAYLFPAEGLNSNRLVEQQHAVLSYPRGKVEDLLEVESEAPNTDIGTDTETEAVDYSQWQIQPLVEVRWFLELSVSSEVRVLALDLLLELTPDLRIIHRRVELDGEELSLIRPCLEEL